MMRAVVLEEFGGGPLDSSFEAVEDGTAASKIVVDIAE
jgi:hypothetical protein